MRSESGKVEITMESERFLIENYPGEVWELLYKTI